MKAKIKFQGREIVIKDIKKVSGFGKVSGLMFRRRETNALLFEFSKGKHAIHSFFCNPFLAIWLLEGKVVEYKIINPFTFSVMPEKEFDKLIEIPANNRYSQAIESLIKEKVIIPEPNNDEEKV